MIRENARRLVLAICKANEVYYRCEQEKRISDTELCVLYALDDNIPHSQKAIAEEWLIPKTTVNSIVKRWEKAGYINQTPVAGTRREKHICLTDSGRVFAADFLKFIYKAEDAALQKTIDKYSTEFIEALEYFNDMIEKEFSED